MFEIAMCD